LQHNKKKLFQKFDDSNVNLALKKIIVKRHEHIQVFIL